MLPLRVLVVIGTFFPSLFLSVDRVCSSTAQGPITQELRLTDTIDESEQFCRILGKSVHTAKTSRSASETDKSPWPDFQISESAPTNSRAHPR